MASTTVAPGWTGREDPGSTATVVVASGPTATTPSTGGVTSGEVTGRLAAAITVVNPNTDDAAKPVMMMRAPAATCGRLLRTGLAGADAIEARSCSGAAHCSCVTGTGWVRVTGRSIGA